jgi:hypothetical protein
VVLADFRGLQVIGKIGGRFTDDDTENAPIADSNVDSPRLKHPYALMMSQYDTEELLGDFVTSLGVRIERNIESAQEPV